MQREAPKSHDFRLFLQTELIRRCQANPRYSLRAFARFLRTDHSSLSQFLRGQRKLSQAAQLKLAMRLGLSPVDIAHFWESDEPTESDSDDSRTTQKDLRKTHELTLDAFQVIADWYHYAIFELVTVKDFDSDPKWIAKTLGISINEVHAAVDRLKRLGLVQVDAKGKWTQGESLITTTGNPFTATAFRKLQAQVLKMALDALEEIPMELRDQSSMTMAVHLDQLPMAKEKIKKFRRELCRDLQKRSDRNAVYQLGISFYPLTKIEVEKSK